MNTSDQTFPSERFLMALALGMTATAVLAPVVLMIVAVHVLSKPAAGGRWSSAPHWGAADGPGTVDPEGLEELRMHGAERCGHLSGLRPLGRSQ